MNAKLTEAVAPSNGVTTNPMIFELFESIFWDIKVFLAFNPPPIPKEGETVGSTPLPPKVADALRNPTFKSSPPDVVNDDGVTFNSTAELNAAIDQVPPVTDVVPGNLHISYLILLNFDNILKSPG